MGYAFGLQAGQPAYQGMEHFIFSDNLILETPSNTVHIEKMDIERVKEIKQTSPTDIYMCGGGMLAGWLLDNNQIDQIKVKINPIVLGKGTKLFENLSQTIKLKLTDQEVFDDGMVILTYDVLRQ